MSGLPRLCWFVIGMSMLERLKPNAVMLYPTGCLNPSTLHYLAGYVYSPPQHVTQLGACRSTHVTVFYTCHLARGVGLGAYRLFRKRGVNGCRTVAHKSLAFGQAATQTPFAHKRVTLLAIPLGQR